MGAGASEGVTHASAWRMQGGVEARLHGVLATALGSVHMHGALHVERKEVGLFVRGVICGIVVHEGVAGNVLF